MDLLKEYCLIPDKELEKIENIRKYILKSGFPTEIEVGNILRKSG